jgi:hypothetical protein
MMISLLLWLVWSIYHHPVNSRCTHFLRFALFGNIAWSAWGCSWSWIFHEKSNFLMKIQNQEETQSACQNKNTISIILRSFYFECFRDSYIERRIFISLGWKRNCQREIIAASNHFGCSVSLAPSTNIEWAKWLRGTRYLLPKFCRAIRREASKRDNAGIDD